MSNVTTINTMNSQVSTAADEQRNVSEEISANIVRINDVSTTTVNQAEETAQAAVKLAEQAENLRNIVNEFKA
jgi:methyl-accepting chemotaxis protein